ncbi:permease [Perkinsela sp. CCAP 1560/4]|nr:permease [Perkinsela sp. CCAP 1560/4]|eukprot:KNH04312.1 permease [Perkinsela sp. CCAP 1560/4]
MPMNVSLFLQQFFKNCSSPVGSCRKHKGFPLWLSELALEIRIPCAFMVWYSIRLTKTFFEAATYFDDRIEGQSSAQQKWTHTTGTLLELKRHTYRHHYLPRYSVMYRFTVDGKTYESRRATTSCMWSEYVLQYLPGDVDVLTEVQYLQSIPPLRANSPCTVFYKIANPRLSALAHDANSYQFTILTSVGIFGLLFATSLKTNAINLLRAYLFRPKRKVIGFPKDRSLERALRSSKN